LFFTFSVMLQKLHKPAIFGFFALFLFIGLAIYKDYGINWDEPLGREYGTINWIYITEKFMPSFLEGKEFCKGCPPLEQYVDADHGPFFELIPTIIEWIFQVKSINTIYHIRHFCVFAFFFIGVYYFYKLLQLRFNRPWISLAGATMLILSPRFFAEAFYNGKDIPFVALIIISCYTLYQFLEKKNFKSAFWHGLICGMAIDVRILGLIMPGLTFALTLLSLNIFRKEGDRLKVLLPALLYFFVFLVISTVLFWPYLWEDALTRFPAVIKSGSKFKWAGEVLYFGKTYFARKEPWHYFTGWLFVTTPVFYSLLFLIGCCVALIKAIKNRLLLFKNKAERLDLIMLGLFFIPYFANIIIGFVLYDGWRHMYALYVPFMYLAVYGFVFIYDKAVAYDAKKVTKRFSYAVMLICFACIGQLAFWIIKNHPYQYVYFAFYKGDRVRQEFDLDYWGLSYKQALEYILENSNKEKIYVFAQNVPALHNRNAISDWQNQRLEFVDDATKADYFIANYRWHTLDFTKEELHTSILFEEHSIKVDGMTIMSVYKLR
jgi:hypothetical protein